MNESPHWKLRGKPMIADAVRAKILRDFDRFARDGLPASVESYLLDAYKLDVSSQFAGRRVKNPWGKASGQLSMTAQQVEEDANSGLGFVVLKTVIAEDETGRQMMKDWAIKESKMVAERIVGKSSGREGWTITWKGRGWWQSFDDYLHLVTDAVSIGRSHDMPVIPSCKYHLPTPDETTWKEAEYRFTTNRLHDAYCAGGADECMPIEKDFSPTLAGSDRAAQKEKILDWLQTVPELIRRHAPGPTKVGLKLFNAMFDDDFQIQMLERTLAADDPHRPDFLTFANRLFDPTKEFEGKVGVAYGGPDLSDRNLRVLDAYWERVARGEAPTPNLPISATGDIHSGRLALEYALRGCSSFQLHTFFQLPGETYPMRKGTKTAKAIHLLYFHPDDGLVAWMHHLRAISSHNTLSVADLPLFPFSIKIA